MSKVVTFLLFAILSVRPALASNKTTPLLFSAVSSGVIHPNLDFRVIATVYSAPEFPVIFKLSLAEENMLTKSSKKLNTDMSDFLYIRLDPKNNSLSGAEIIFDENGNKEVIINTTNLTLASHYTLTATVNSGNITATGNSSISRASNLIFITTDKGLYKPGETVKFRVLVLDRFLRPLKLKENITVDIRDAKGHIVKTWKSSAGATIGLTSLSLALSNEPNYGNWHIIATARDMSEFAKFKVEQYVLPKFKLNVYFNQQFVTMSSSQLVMDIDLKYTYGKPVRAVCTIEVLVSPSYYDKQQNFTLMTNITTRLTIDVKKGLTKVWNTLFEGYPIPTKISTICTETATGYVQNLTTWLPMYKHSHTLIVQESPDIVLAEQPYEVGIKAIWRNGSCINNLDSEAINVYRGFTPISPSRAIINGTVKFWIVAPAVNTSYKRGDHDVIIYGFNGVTAVTDTKVLTDINKCSKEMKLSTGLVKAVNDRRITVRVTTTTPIIQINVILVSQGALLGYNYSQFNMPGLETIVTLDIPGYVTYHKLEILSYAVCDGTLVSNKFSLTVPDSDVKINLNTNTTEPGGTAEIKVTGFQGDSRSIFGLRAIDTSLLIADDGVDLAHSWISKNLKYLKGTGYEYTRVYSSFTFQNFLNTDTRIITNGLLDTTLTIYPDYHDTCSKGGASSQRDFNKVNDIPVRSHFPETWIWEEMESSDGTVKFNKTVPDTITSWTLSAFQLHTEYGLRITTYPKTLTVFKPFFISLIYPHSVVKGEELLLKVLVQNYLDAPVNAAVTLNNSNQHFRFIEMGGEQAFRTKVVAVNASSIVTLTFKIGFVHHGKFDLEASAVTPIAVDALKQKIIVKHAGIKHTNSKVIIKSPSKRYSRQRVNASFPPDSIAGSEEVTATITQDFLSTTLQNLETLIKLPSGCGEQNMVKFVPDLVILEYMEVSGSITTSLRAAILNYLELGYQQQLSYLNKDGSYSAFQFEEVGSTWLTAFVTRAFSQAKKYITIDQYVLERSVNFLLDKQQQDGSFREDGFVHDRSLLGGAGSTSNKLALTALSLLAIFDAQRNAISARTLSTSNYLTKGIQYILQQPQNTTNPYTANLLTYFLYYINHPNKEDYYRISSRMWHMERGNIFWDPYQSTYQGPTTVNSATIEVTAYGLLIQVLRKDAENSANIANWLIKQKNAQGGFLSTQDTIMGITALAKYNEFANSKNNSHAVNTTISWEGGSQSFALGGETEQDVYTAALPRYARNVRVETQGTGASQVQLDWSYYSEIPATNVSFSLDISVENSTTLRNLVVRPCATYNKDNSSNMVVLEMSAPSGYSFNSEEPNSLKETKVIQRYELEDDSSRLFMYFSNISGRVVKCINLTITMEYEVSNHVGGQGKIYDYYDSSQGAEVTYTIPELPMILEE